VGGIVVQRSFDSRGWWILGAGGLIILIGLVSVLVVLLGFVVWKQRRTLAATKQKASADLQELRKQFEEEKKMLESQFEDEKKDLQKQHEQSLQRMREQIESDREVLSQKGDKELLIDVVLALDGYASRMQRLEDSLRVGSIKKSIQQASDAMTSATEDLKSSLVYRIEELNDSITEAIDVSRIVDMLESIQSNTDDIRSDISLYSVSSSVDEIKSRVDSMYWDMSAVKDAAESARDAAEEAKSAAESARWAAEEAKDAAGA